MNMDEYSAIEWLVEDIKDVQSRLEETEDYIRQADKPGLIAFIHVRGSEERIISSDNLLKKILLSRKRRLEHKLDELRHELESIQITFKDAHIASQHEGNDMQNSR